MLDQNRLLATIATCLLSFVIGIVGITVCSGLGLIAVIFIAALFNLNSVAHLPFLRQQPNLNTLMLSALPALAWSSGFGLLFMGWLWGTTYGLFAMAVYLASAARASN